jgi:endonuclease/exonuclease/phosphatase family metal-dependent hydrolase
LKLRSLIAAVVAFGALAVPTAASAAEDEVTVMSRNIYLGSDLSPAINAPTIEQAIDGAGQIYNEVVRTNFPARAVALAEEIRRGKPDLVGLQEVAHWTVQTPSDIGGPPINPNAQPASDNLYNFLDLLTDEVGSKYRVVGVQNEFEAELPADTDQNDATGGFAGADLDARLLMRDVILARKGVKTSKVRSDNYVNRFETSVGGVPVFADRGWISTEAKVGDASFRFVNTHLEAFGDPSIRAAQAKELVKKPAKSDKDVILVGDMNSDKDDSDGSEKAYETITKAGFVVRQSGGGTSGHDDSLTDPNDQDQFDRKIDFVFANDKKIKLVKDKSQIVGRDDPSEMTSTTPPLWPSDHAGVLSTLEFG